MKFPVLGLACRVKLVTPLAGVWVEIIYANHLLPTVVVTPLAGVWVEITEYNKDGVIDLVTPLAGVWVEMDEHFFGEHRKSSLPLRECGLKLRAMGGLLRQQRHSPCGSVEICPDGVPVLS